MSPKHQHDYVAEPGGRSTPPIPPRNPLRDRPFLSTRRRSIQAKRGGTTVSSSPAAQSIFNEIDREIEETQQRLVSAVYTNQSGWRDSTESSQLKEGMPISVARSPSLRSRFSLGVRAADEEGDASPASTRSSLTDGLKRCSAYLGFGKVPTQSEDIREKISADVDTPTTGLHSRLDDIKSMSTISSYDGSPTTLQAEEEDAIEEARVEAWLRRESFSIPPLEPDRFSPSTKARSNISENPHSPLKIFPPVSLSTGKREYSSSLTSPLSPVGNGRDAYGNFIPTNTQDYFTAQSPPTSPSLQSIMEETALKIHDSTPRMRGGGTWWNSLGLGSPGREPSLKSKASSIRPGSSQRNTPIQRLHGKAFVASNDETVASPTGNGGGVYNGTVPSTPVSPAKDRRSIVTEDWSDESDDDQIEAQILSPGQPSVINASPIQPQFGSVQNRRSKLSRQTPPTSPAPRLPPSTPRKGLSTVSNPLHLVNFKKKSVLDLDDLWSTVSSSNFSGPSGERPGTPLSQASYAPRPDRRWNSGPGSPPPQDKVLPPPPLAPVGNRPGMFSPPKEKAVYKYHLPIHRPTPHHQLPSALSIRASSPPPFPQPTPFSASTWDLASLALGESVSVYNPFSTRPHPPPTPTEHAALRAQSQSSFRDLCHAIMTQYTAEIARTEHDLAAGSISQTQFEHQVRFMIGNKNQALRHSAERTGYTILSPGDEDGILEAMESVDGYAIYHDLLSATKPALWTRLEARYRAAAAAKEKGLAIGKEGTGEAEAESVRSGGSSFEAARHVVGKIARFVLAAPGDEGVKTFSKRGMGGGMGGVVFSPMGVPIMGGGMGGTTGITDGGESSGEVWKRSEKQSKKEKGKARPMGPGPIEAMTAIPGRISHPDPPPQNLRYTSPHRQHQDSHPTISACDATSQVITDVSIWPVDDGEGNWYSARRIGDVIIRGGGGNKKSKDKKVRKGKAKKEKMHAWSTMNPERGMAMHYLT